MEIWRNLTDTIARYGDLPYICARITENSTKPEMFLMFQTTPYVYTNPIYIGIYTSGSSPFQTEKIFCGCQTKTT